MIITNTDILGMANALLHICNYEGCDYGEKQALDIANGIVANSIDFKVDKNDEHNEWIELHDAFGDLVAIKRSAIIAIFKDIAGQTVVSCGDYKVKVKENYNRVTMEVCGK